MNKYRWISFPLVTALICAQMVAPVLAVDPHHNRLFRLLPCFQEDVGKEPATGKETCMEELARNIDWLEHQIDVFGSVVPKTPDVWGEARLTAHRQEFEGELVKELTKFDFNRVNGAQLVQDQSFLAFALSVKNAQLTGANGVPAPEITINNTPAASATGTTISTGAPSSGGTINQAPFGDPAHPFGLSNSNLTFGSQNGIELEQTEVLDQLVRYINHLHEHRRINEGDDTSDAPGYAMNLVRIPISVLPGSATKHGYGAEITVTAEPYLGPELLPMAFRDFVINDLVEQLSLPMTRFLNSDPALINQLRPAFAGREQLRIEMDFINQQLATVENFWGDDKRASLLVKAELERNPPSIPLVFFSIDGTPLPGAHITVDTAQAYNTDHNTLLDASKIKPTDLAKQEDWGNIVYHSTEGNIEKYVPLMAQYDSSIDTKGVKQRAKWQKSYSGDTNTVDTKKFLDQLKEQPEARKEYGMLVYEAAPPIPAVVSSISTPAISSLSNTAIQSLQASIPSISLPASTTRKSTLPFPPSHLEDNFGLHELGHIVMEAHQAFQNDVLNREVVHITDVQALLREELGAAHELLRTDEMRVWWNQAADGNLELYKAIRQRNQPAIERLRDEFLNAIGPYVRHHRSTASLAWCIYVESILLNERLIQDIKETFGNQASSPVIADWLPYFGPYPCQEARDAFAQYVRVRWPIHVFHIDPVNTEQNIADVSSVYRQMQMAVALAFSQRRIGVSAALQTMRKLQRDRATFDLNRTVVGFGHGDDTFGWKFYPRFQTPPVESNVTVFFRDLVIGGPTDKQLECGKEIEPGQRECTAVVLMPSFVPHVTFHTRSNWFRLNCASHTASSVHDTVHYSRVVKQMESNAMQCGQCANLYRDGEVDRLMKRVHQLDRKLALQTLECQVPIENTHGGFEIFSAGTRELAPELVGWYGAPGYDASRPGRMFLSGDNFSVSTCRLIAGNQEIPFKLLSRQIMEVTLPAGLPVIHDHKLMEAGVQSYAGYIDAHVATPYGVSGHLLIPAVRNNALNGRIQMAPQVVRLTAGFTVANGVYTVTMNNPADVSPFIFDVPSAVSSGTGTETFGLTLTTGIQSVPGGEIGAAVTPGTTVAVATAAKTLELFTDAAQLKGKLGQFVKSQLDSGANPSTPATFQLTAMLKRGTASNQLFLPVDGSITIEVVLIPPAAASGGVPSGQNVEGFAQNGYLPPPAGPTFAAPNSGYAPAPAPYATAAPQSVSAPYPSEPMQQTAPPRFVDYRSAPGGSVPMMSSAPTATGFSNPQPPVFVAPKPGLRKNLLSDR